MVPHRGLGMVLQLLLWAEHAKHQAELKGRRSHPVMAAAALTTGAEGASQEQIMGPAAGPHSSWQVNLRLGHNLEIVTHAWSRGRAGNEA